MSMSALLYLDVETSDWVREDLPPDDPAQPTIVQLAAVLADERRTYAALAALVRQDQWAPRRGRRVLVAQRATDKHGITDADCERWGEPPDLLLHSLRRMTARADLVVGHNVSFDTVAVDQALAMQSLPRMSWPNSFCTMRESAAIVKIPGRGSGEWKWPRLAEAYYHFTKRELRRAHDALHDVYACRQVYLGIVRHRTSALAKDGVG